MATEVTARVTVKVVMPLIEPEAAVMIEEPAARPDASPLLVIVALEGFEELHVTELVRLLVLPLV
jgi:hypothetical protein